GWGASGQGSVAAFVVVLMAEGLEEVCSCWIVAGGSGCLRSQFFIVWWKRSTLPWVWGWLPRLFFWTVPRAASSCSKALRPPRTDTVMSGKPVGWINPSTSPQRAVRTYESLETVLSYTGAAIVEDACLDIPIGRSLISDIGDVEDSAIRERIRTVVHVLTSLIN